MTGTPMKDAVAEMRALKRERLTLHEGGGGGTFDGMEPRIAKLEAQMEAVRADLARLVTLPVDVARLDERVKHLPGKGFIVMTTSTALALLTAAIVFADKLRVLVG